MASPALEQSEDCLTVNVFRPKLPPESPSSPVAICIHGGAFNRGSATMHSTHHWWHGQKTPFIAVSFNYRIGALAFLPSALSTTEGALNLGLWDQVLLLE